VMDALKKSKSTYYSRCKEAESAQAQYEKAKSEGTIKPKDLNKLHTKATKAIEQANLADEEYKRNIKKANSKQAKFIELEMPMLLKEFQTFEENRLNFLKKQFSVYKQLHGELPDFLQTVGASLQKSIDSINVEHDIKTYAEENRTNFTSPAEIQYEVYAWENPNLAASQATSTSLPTLPSHTDTAKAPVQKIEPAKVEMRQASSPREDNAPKVQESSNAIVRAQGLYDYKATNDSEMSFNAGDVLIITEQDDSGWWFAEHNGNVGFVPRNYLTVV